LEEEKTESFPETQVFSFNLSHNTAHAIGEKQQAQKF
jgi:hypothetical protein